jgi:hypothetical protein
MPPPSRKAPPRLGPKGALSSYKKLHTVAPHPSNRTPFVAPSKPTSYKLPLLIAGGATLVGVIIAIAIVAGLKLFPGQSSSSSTVPVVPAIFANPPTVGPSLCNHPSVGPNTNQPFYEVGQVGSFEWPWVGYGLVEPLVAESCSQPWEPLRSTIASMGSSFDPSPGLAAPDGVHYGVFQAANGALENSVWYYIPTPAPYVLTFYYSSVGLVHGNCTVGQNSTTVWSNQNMVKDGLWHFITTDANTPVANIYAAEIVCQGSGVVVFDAFKITAV